MTGRHPETRLGKRTGLAKTYEIPDTWHVRCPVEGGWIAAAGCNEICCTDHIGKRMKGDILVIDCQAM